MSRSATPRSRAAKCAPLQTHQLGVSSPRRGISHGPVPLRMVSVGASGARWRALAWRRREGERQSQPGSRVLAAVPSVAAADATAWPHVVSMDSTAGRPARPRGLGSAASRAFWAWRRETPARAGGPCPQPRLSKVMAAAELVPPLRPRCALTPLGGGAGAGWAGASDIERHRQPTVSASHLHPGTATRERRCPDGGSGRGAIDERAARDRAGRAGVTRPPASVSNSSVRSGSSVS